MTLPYDLADAAPASLRSVEPLSVLRLRGAPGSPLGGETALVLLPSRECLVFVRGFTRAEFSLLPLASESPLRYNTGTIADALEFRDASGDVHSLSVDIGRSRAEVTAFFATMLTREPVQSQPVGQVPPGVAQASPYDVRMALLAALEEPTTQLLDVLQLRVSQLSMIRGESMSIDLDRIRNELLAASGSELAELARMLRDAWSGAGSSQGQGSELFRVVILDGGMNKISAIKAVRELSGLGLKEAKDVVETSRGVVKTNLSSSEANQMVRKLRETGATAAVEQM